MTTNELSIGNKLILNDTDEIFTVTGIMQDSNGTKVYGLTDAGIYCNAWIEHCRPIPLTEEWLVRSGFKYDEIMYLQHFKSRNGEKLYIGLSKCRIGWSLHLTTFNNQITNFEYFHDLQNFIFSLTGKELKFNN